jgi:hypothetical protein
MTSLSGQFFYHLIVNNLAPILASSATSISSSYFSNRAAPPLPTMIRPEHDDERELDLLQMDRMLIWMRLIFEDTFVSVEKDTPGQAQRPQAEREQAQRPQAEAQELHKGYKKELYSIYMSIRSDYSQYQQWKQYNNSIWMFSSYRNKDTKALAKKILSDVKLFHEGLKMFSMFEKL